MKKMDFKYEELDIKIKWGIFKIFFNIKIATELFFVLM